MDIKRLYWIGLSLQIVRERISRTEIQKFAAELFGDMVKVVVDVHRNVMAIGGELHADGEALLLNDGSKQEHLWGANIYPDAAEEDQIVYRALINIRPQAGNRSMEIVDGEIRRKVRAVIESLVF